MAAQHIHVMPPTTHIVGPRQYWLQRQDMRDPFVLRLDLNFQTASAKMVGDFQIILMAGDL
jgi:hypothetical protein